MGAVTAQLREGSGAVAAYSLVRWACELPDSILGQRGYFR